MQEYKDVSRVTAGGDYTKWDRLKLESVDGWVKDAKADGSLHVWASIQTFHNDVVTTGEEYASDFYMDFDGANALEEALEDVCRAILWLEKEGINKSHIRCWYSGQKGFHLIVPRQLFGAMPHKSMHKYWRIIADKMKLETTDHGVYKTRSMWRVENTINTPKDSSKPSYYKIPLSIDEVFELSIPEIQSLAVKEQPSIPQKATKWAPVAVDLYDSAISKANIPLLESRWKTDFEIPQFKESPPCIRGLLENGIFELGTLNMVMFRLSAYFKSQGLDRATTNDLMKEWSVNIKAEHTHNIVGDRKNRDSTDLVAIHGQISYICTTVFANDNYGFSCAGILQIPGLDVYCELDCKKKLEEKIEITLFDAFKVEYIGKRLYIDAEAIGRLDNAFAVPEKITATCNPSTSIKNCKGCPLHEQIDGIEVTLTANRKGILLFLDSSGINLTGRVGMFLGLPKKHGGCDKWSYSMTYRNCETIDIAPRITNNYGTDKYTRQTAYYLGHGLETNNPYTFSGYMHIRDVNAVMVLVLDEAKPLANTLTEFEYTVEMQVQSNLFKPAYNQSVRQKHDHIVKALNYNHTRVWGREQLIKAVDLIYHSVNSFWFQRELISGRLDVLIIGDTGQGKSKVVDDLMRHYDLGIMVQGESAGRTGLVYTIPMKEGGPAHIIWGVIPRYNRRLVAVDELEELVEDGSFKQLREIRSKGEVTVTRTVFGKAQTQTRFIWIANPPGRKTMGSWNFSVKAIMDLIPHNADIRRCTFAVGVSSNQVDDAMINVNINELEICEDMYTSDICHNHLLWVWNLEPEDIVISEHMETTILKVAQDACQEYSASIPLVEPGDFRHKLARLCVAIAARMSSRDKDNRLIIKQEHIDYAYQFINELYADDALGYHTFSVYDAELIATNEQLEKYASTFRNQWPLIWKKIVRFVVFNDYTDPKELAAVAEGPEGDMKNCMAWLSGYKLMERTVRGHYCKTENGVRFFDLLTEHGDTKPTKSVREIMKGDDDGF